MSPWEQSRFFEETMAWDLFLWIVSFFISLALVASVFYQVIPTFFCFFAPFSFQLTSEILKSRSVLGF